MKTILLLTAVFIGSAFCQTPKKNWTMPRTPDGHPDLQGIWTNATLTPMERPAQFANQATLSDAEAKAYEKKDLEASNIDQKESTLLRQTGDVETGGYNNLFIDRGSELARVDGVKRTALIVDPADGHAPPISEKARQAQAGGGAAAGDSEAVTIA